MSPSPVGQRQALPAHAEEGPNVPNEGGFTSARVERVFLKCFGNSHRTRLLGGAAEPCYQPAQGEQRQHLLFYREDFFASALHETAHWCIAGEARRELPDFGYWYAAQGRSAAAQREFEAVEDKPQALEWFFSQACGASFQLSADNFDPHSGEVPDTSSFAQRVVAQALYWQRAGLPKRAEQFYCALCREFGTLLAPSQLSFLAADIR